MGLLVVSDIKPSVSVRVSARRRWDVQFGFYEYNLIKELSIRVQMGCKGNHQGQDNISRPSSQWDTTTTDGSEMARERSCHQIPERERRGIERESGERPLAAFG